VRLTGSGSPGISPIYVRIKYCMDLLSQANISSSDLITRLLGWSTSTTKMYWLRIVVRTLLQFSLEVESILIGFVLKVTLSKFWHVINGLFVWVGHTWHQPFALIEYY
jgi:hypothetical protein